MSYLLGKEEENGKEVSAHKTIVGSQNNVIGIEINPNHIIKLNKF